jgi:hypothetical protein
MAKAKRDGTWLHDDSKDMKADPDKAEGINVLPDGNVAMTKQFIEDAYESINEGDDSGDEED